MAKIFLSHSVKDKELVRKLAKAFKDLGAEVLYDDLVLKPGHDMNRVLQDAIRDSDAMIVVVTKNSRGSDSVMDEVSFARRIADEKARERFIIPMLLLGVDIPHFIRDLFGIVFSENELESAVQEVYGSMVVSDRKTFGILKEGDRSEQVQLVQQALRKRKLLRSPADGIYGPATVAAVSDFQGSAKLNVTGVVDEITYQQLFAEEGSGFSSSSQSTSSAPPEPDPTAADFWLLRIHYNRWLDDGLEEGAPVYYTTHTSDSKPRTEYAEYGKMKENDLVLAYDFDTRKKVTALFRVTKGMHVSKERGEIVSGVVETIFEQPLSIDKFRDQAPFKLIDQPGKERLIRLEKAVFDEILNQKENIQKISRRNFVPRALYKIRNRIDPVLGTVSVATEIAELIRRLEYTDIGKMIGIFGHWGRGKTFMVEQVWEKLKGTEEKTSEFIRVDFHAWKYQDTNASWAYLYEAFAQKYFEKKGNWFSRRWDDTGKRIDLNMARHGTWPIVRFLFTLAVTAVSIGCALHYKQYYTFILTALGLADGVRLIFKYFDQYKLKMKASEVFTQYFNKPTFKDLLGVQSEIQKELRHLLECWIPLKDGIPKKRIILFVDDIDRCSEERIIQIIDALRVMLEDPEISLRVTVVAAIDERMLKRAIKWKYKELLDADRTLADAQRWNETTLQITSEYMDKLFLSGIKLGTLTSAERTAIYGQFSKGGAAPKPQEEPKEEQSTEEKAASNPVPVTPAAPGKTGEETAVVTDIVQTPGAPVTLTNEGVKNTPPPADDKESDTPASEGFELSFEEDELLRRHVADMTEATPRQIRIFYYRYMLARNLLTQALIEQGQDAKFSTDARNQLIADLLTHYSVLKSNHELMEDRKLFLKGRAQMDQLSAKTLIEQQDALLVAEVLDVLEMVIAY